MNLKDILLNKVQKQELASFYIIENTDEEFLLEWMYDLLAKVLNKTTNRPYDKALETIKLGHPDILIITPGDEQTYKIEDGSFDELFKFNQYSVVELPWRFAIVTHPHLINDQYANKLLKTLEEPAAKTSIFFLNHSQTKLLSTIQSRAIKLRLPREENGITKKSEEKIEAMIDDYLEKSIELSKIYDYLRKNKNEEESFIKLVTKKACELNLSAQKLKEFEDNLEHYHKAKTFNNSLSERVSVILNSLQ